MTIRVLIADDHPLVRQGLKAALAPMPDVEVVAEAATGTAAVREAVLHRPDVVVMDLQMPELNGIDATRELARAVPSAAVLVLTMFDDDDSVFAAMRAGARGYVLKGAEQQEIARAIAAVAAGEAIFGPGVATRLLSYFATPPRTPTPFRSSPPGSVRSWTCWPPAATTTRSPTGSASASRPWPTTSRPSSPSSRWPTEPRPSSAPATPASATPDQPASTDTWQIQPGMRNGGQVWVQAPRARRRAEHRDRKRQPRAFHSSSR
jgi:DNA-binding NarL/FixJ family response regulator